jgi:hypothetical protein
MGRVPVCGRQDKKIGQGDMRLLTEIPFELLVAREGGGGQQRYQDHRQHFHGC